MNTASRMESTGEAFKIHISRDTKELLDRVGGYYCQERGMTPIKGKGEMLTFWLRGEDPAKRLARMRRDTSSSSFGTNSNSSARTFNPLKTNYLFKNFSKHFINPGFTDVPIRPTHQQKLIPRTGKQRRLRSPRSGATQLLRSGAPRRRRCRQLQQFEPSLFRTIGAKPQEKTARS